MFSLIFLGVATLIYLFFYSLNHIRSQYTEITDVHYDNIVNLEKFNNLIGKNQIIIEQYFSTKDEKLKAEQTAVYEQFEVLMSSIKQNIPSEMEGKVSELIKAVETHTATFESVASLTNTQGNSKSGIRGDLRKAAHNLEKFINENGLSSYYQVKLLTFRRREKDFLLRKDSKYLNKLYNDIKELKTRVTDKKLDEVRKTKLLKLTSDYTKHFEKLVSNVQELKSKHEELLANHGSISSLINTLVLSSHKGLNLFKEKVETDIKKEATVVIGISALIVLVIFFINYFAYKFSNSLAVDVLKLKDISEDFVKSCDKISTNSTRLTQLTTSQSSSIQETASSVNEISAMVSKNSEAAVSSKKVSENNSAAAEQGKTTITEVLKAMDQLSSSSSSITNRFHKTSEELQGVVAIIQQIGEKAKVINLSLIHI